MHSDGDFLLFQADTPLSQALEALGAPEWEYCLISARREGQGVLLRLHRAEGYARLADVPRERLHALLRPLLTPRETEIAALLFESRTIRCIAGTLHIAEGTVKRIIHNLYQKMNVSSQVELVRDIYARLARQFTV